MPCFLGLGFEDCLFQLSGVYCGVASAGFTHAAIQALQKRSSWPQLENWEAVGKGHTAMLTPQRPQNPYVAVDCSSWAKGAN